MRTLYMETWDHFMWIWLGLSYDPPAIFLMNMTLACSRSSPTLGSMKYMSNWLGRKHEICLWLEYAITLCVLLKFWICDQFVSNCEICVQEGNMGWELAKQQVENASILCETTIIFLRRVPKALCISVKLGWWLIYIFFSCRVGVDLYGLLLE